MQNLGANSTWTASTVSRFDAPLNPAAYFRLMSEPDPHVSWSLSDRTSLGSVATFRLSARHCL